MTIDSNTTLVVLPKDVLDGINEQLAELKELIMGGRNTENQTEWLDSSTAMKMLGVSSKTWQEYRNKRVIPFAQFGRKIYVKRTDLYTFIESHKIK